MANNQTVPVHKLMMGKSCTGCGTALELQWMVESGIFAEGEVTLGVIITREPADFDQARYERRKAQGL